MSKVISFQVSGLYKYKIYGSLDVEPSICAQVYMDLDYRKSWDTYVNGEWTPSNQWWELLKLHLLISP